ncbi:right-handed parallel beta-helix repeat-containing protein [Motilibacter deserti]|uniref:right-handed parallel beta-helix repeat-containing protein n=1 Tax=Motilibacter deserti TaxID=2714956 RepID=UPI00140AB07B
MSLLRRGCALLPLTLLGSVALGGAAAGTASAADAKPWDAAPPATYQGDADHEAALVEAEEERILAVRKKVSLIRWQDQDTYRAGKPKLDEPNDNTVILIPKTNRAAYTVNDLLAVGILTKQADGGLLLENNLFLPPKSTLSLGGASGPIRMRSGADGTFVSIVSIGGALDLSGTEQKPLVVQSWDPQANEPDTLTNDGRAYIRAIGGEVMVRHADFSDLGFWSGSTAGVALTGTDRSNSIDPTRIASGEPAKPSGKTERNAARDARRQEQAQNDVLAKNGITDLNVLDDPEFATDEDTFVSGEVSDSTFTGNAFGLFVSGAKSLNITDTVIQRSLVDGLVLHRYVSSGSIERMTSKLNGGTGFTLARAAQHINIQDSIAEANRGDGFYLSGEALADGPSVTGAQTKPWGSNTVANSYSRNNAHNGIEVVGGVNLDVNNNEITGNDMGIVVRSAASKVSVTANRLVDNARHAVSVRDGVTDATVSGNAISGGTTGIYVRGSVAEVLGNTVKDADGHGVSFVGAVAGSSITNNFLAGEGSSALDDHRSSGKVEVSDNVTSSWVDTSSIWVKLKSWIHPMTLIWLFIAFLILFTAARGRRARGVMGAPYSAQLPHQVTAATAYGEEVVSRPAARTIDIRKANGTKRTGGSTHDDDMAIV